jgi:zinc transport system substrate-binding protein
MGCGKKKAERGDEKVRLSVTIEPLRYYAEKIGGDRVEVTVLVPAGQSPETYEPTAGQVSELSKSEGFLYIGGLGFEEAWLGKIKKTHLELQLFKVSEGMVREKGDPHVWPSFEGAKTLTVNTLKVLKALDEKGATYYERRYEELVEELRTKEARVQEMLKGKRGMGFIIYHPTLTYFAREFGLNQLVVEKNGKEPSMRELMDMVVTARELEVKVALVQEEFSTRQVEGLAEVLECKVLTLHPLSYDSVDELVGIAEALSDGGAD